MPTLAPPGGRGGSDDYAYGGAATSVRRRAAPACATWSGPAGRPSGQRLVLLSGLGRQASRCSATNTNTQLVELPTPEAQGHRTGRSRRAHATSKAASCSSTAKPTARPKTDAGSSTWCRAPTSSRRKSGGSTVTSSVVTVREGVPATVVLSIPEGAGAFGDAAQRLRRTGVDPEKGVRAQAAREARLRRWRRGPQRTRAASSQASCCPCRRPGRRPPARAARTPCATQTRVSVFLTARSRPGNQRVARILGGHVSAARRRIMTAGARITDAVNHFARRGNFRSAVKLVRTRPPERLRWRAAVGTLTLDAGRMLGDGAHARRGTHPRARARLG